MESSSGMIVTNAFAVHLLKPMSVSAGVSVCRLLSGAYAIGVRRGDQHLVIDLTRSELRQLIEQLGQLTSS